jgi:hypothetical protein
MGTIYKLENTAAPTGGPNQGAATSLTLFTMLQVQASAAGAGYPMRVVEWGVSFNDSALAVPFACDLVDSGTVAATVTAFAAADVTVVTPDTPAQSGTTSGSPFVLSTTASGFTSTAEGTITTVRSFDSQQVQPVGGYFKQFPPERTPLVTPGHNLRVRVHGDGTTKVVAYVVVEV